MSATTATRAELTMGLALVAIAALCAGLAGAMHNSTVAEKMVGPAADAGAQSPAMMPEVLVTADVSVPVMPEVLVTAEPTLPIQPEVLITAPRQNQNAPTSVISTQRVDAQEGIGGRPANGPRTDIVGYGAGLLRRSPALTRPLVD